MSCLCPTGRSEVSSTWVAYQDGNQNLNQNVHWNAQPIFYQDGFYLHSQYLCRQLVCGQWPEQNEGTWQRTEKLGTWQMSLSSQPEAGGFHIGGIKARQEEQEDDWNIPSWQTINHGHQLYLREKFCTILMIISCCICLFVAFFSSSISFFLQTSQELRMLSNVTLYCQVAKIVMNSGSQLSEL